jgi:DNA-binding NtrC family response regulator
MLRVLHTKEIERVGGSEPIPVDIRIVAATHRNLEDMVEAGRFREDLWFRLNVFPIQIPPLRERKGDIPGLVHHFIGRKSKELRCLKPPVPAPGAIDRLLTYSWPGNVRELENVVERAMILNKNGPLTFDHLVPNSHELRRPTVRFREDEPLGLDAVMAEHIQKVLALTGGKIHGPGGAAEVLAVNPSTLRNKMDRLGISYGRKNRKSRSLP